MNKETVEEAGKRLGFSKPNYVEFDGHQNEGFYFDIFKKGWDAAFEQLSTPTDKEIDRICVRGCHDFILEKGIMTPITPKQYYTAGYKQALIDVQNQTK